MTQIPAVVNSAHYPSVTQRRRPLPLAGDRSNTASGNPGFTQMLRHRPILCRHLQCSMPILRKARRRHTINPRCSVKLQGVFVW